ncbi:HNH endonuclease [Microbacterium sp. NPDC055455]
MDEERSAEARARKAAYDREYYLKNKERRAAQKRAHYLNNLDKYREYSVRNRESQLRRNAERRKANPEEHREQQSRRRAAMYGAGSYRVSNAALERERRRSRNVCQYCHEQQGEHWDHRVPLIRGGAHGIGNLTLACGFCNHQKHAKTVMEWRLWRRRAGLPDLHL